MRSAHDEEKIDSLRLYNQFPRLYKNIPEMEAQLPEIAKMGFNAVWLNPIQEVDRNTRYFKKTGGLRPGIYGGSLYSPNSLDDPTDIRINADFSLGEQEDDIAALKSYTAHAKELGVMPIFDLLLNQVGVDAEIASSHPDWFKKGPFGPTFYWDHPNEKIRAEIIAYMKAMIYTYIVDFGFTGVRVDAVKHVPADVQKEIYEYITQLCIEHHQIRPIIFAETLNLAPDDWQNLTGLGISHTMNFLDYKSFVQENRKSNSSGKGYWEAGYSGAEDAQKALGELREIVHSGEAINQPGGGSIGPSGTHDHGSLYFIVLNNRTNEVLEKKYSDEGRNDKLQFLRNRKFNFNTAIGREIEEERKVTQKNLQRYYDFSLDLKQQIAGVALTSDSGWYLLSGDEFGDKDKKFVFDNYKPLEKGSDFTEGWGGKYDVRSFISGINSILKTMPPTNDVFWVEHIVLESKPELMIVVRHNSSGFDPENTHLVIVNLSNKKLSLNSRDMKSIAELSSRRGGIEAEQCIHDTIKLGHCICLDASPDASINHDYQTEISSLSTDAIKFKPIKTKKEQERNIQKFKPVAPLSSSLPALNETKVRIPSKPKTESEKSALPKNLPRQQPYRHLKPSGGAELWGKKVEIRSEKKPPEKEKKPTFVSTGRQKK